MPKNAAIGIFDSGIGGLTVAHALKEKLPNESIVYFGDTNSFQQTRYQFDFSIAHFAMIGDNEDHKI